LFDAARYESLADRNDVETPWFKRKMDSRQALVQPLAGHLPGARILEVGCAEGELGRRVKAQLPVRYDGIELSRDAERAQQVLDQVFQAPAAGIAAPAYDLIVSFHVLEHIAAPGAELAAWSQLLAENGRLIIEVPNRAGHPLLDTDQNPEHLHQFTPASLALLLTAQGFACESITVGHYESPVYPDSIRAVAVRNLSATQRRNRLIARFRERLGGPFVVYGIGGDFKNYVEPLLDDLEIKALLDTAPDKWGRRIGNFTVAAYDAGQHGERPILISSIKFGLNIKRHLLAQGISPTRLVGLEEIYEPA
jgi:SAM-dependent methyltransferase